MRTEQPSKRFVPLQKLKSRLAPQNMFKPHPSYSLLTVPRRQFCCGSMLPVFGVRVSVTFHLMCVHIISSHGPSGSQVELLVCPCSGVRCRRQQCSNISYETAWPIKAKFYVEPPWEGGTHVYINHVNCPGHMTKMAAMPYMINTFIYFFFTTRSPIYDLKTWQRELKVYKNDDPGLTLTYFMTRPNLAAYAFKWENCYKVTG